MPTNPDPLPRQLPSSPSLRHLKDQAKDLFKSGHADSLARAQFQIAHQYGFATLCCANTALRNERRPLPSAVPPRATQKNRCPSEAKR
jgi:hypothetical protein